MIIVFLFSSLLCAETVRLERMTIPKDPARAITFVVEDDVAPLTVPDPSGELSLLVFYRFLTDAAARTIETPREATLAIKDWPNRLAAARALLTRVSKNSTHAKIRARAGELLANHEWQGANESYGHLAKSWDSLLNELEAPFKRGRHLDHPLLVDLMGGRDHLIPSRRESRRRIDLQSERAKIEVF